MIIKTIYIVVCTTNMIMIDRSRDHKGYPLICQLCSTSDAAICGVTQDHHEQL